METIYRKVDKEEVLQISSRVLQYLKIELKEFKLSPSIYNNVARLLTELDSLQPIEPQETKQTAVELKNKIYDKITDDLKSSRLEGLETDDGDKYPLIDYLSKGTTIKEGLSEVDNIIEQIDIDDLLQEYAEAYHQEKKKTECHCGGYPDCICDITRAAKLKNMKIISEMANQDELLRDQIEPQEPKCEECPSRQFYEANTAKIMDKIEQPKEISVTDEEIEKIRTMLSMMCFCKPPLLCKRCKEEQVICNNEKTRKDIFRYLTKIEESIKINAKVKKILSQPNLIDERSEEERFADARNSMEHIGERHR